VYEIVEAVEGRRMTRKTRDEELEAVADMLEMLALEVRAMTGSVKKKSGPAQTRSCDEFFSGRRVRIIVRDKYHGRTGVLVDRRGTEFWNIRLDCGDGEVYRVIYKKETSLVLID
jgi:ribosomal protein L21E